jgi:hypothetical protein
MAEAQKPAQKYNKAFVQLLKDLLAGKRDLSLQIAAVLTRLASFCELLPETGRALEEFWKANKRAPKELRTVQEKTDTELSTEG